MNSAVLRPAPLLESIDETQAPGVVIANPPYFKIPKSDPRVALLPEIVHGQPNIYSLFMATAAKILAPGGQLLFITPRSFCSGSYFRQFRKWFFQNIALDRLHLFASRTEAFEADEVLQENVILSGRRTAIQPERVTISTSAGTRDLARLQERDVPLREVIDLNSKESVVHIPLEQTDSAVRSIFAAWPSRLESYGIASSTGPIVPFRTHALVDEQNGNQVAPVLWMQHVGRMSVIWPLSGFGKPQRISVTTDTQKLLLPNSNYILIRRFSAKEDNCRITAAPYFKGDLSFDFLGIENHVNYLHRPDGSLTRAETSGLSAFLNSRWVDQFFRQLSGNTQVNATDLRILPLPPLDKIKRIGERLLDANGIGPVGLINQVVGEELGLSTDPHNGTGGHMSKIEEAKEFLGAIRLPRPQRNELAALTLLSLANLKEPDQWRNAQRRSLRIHDIILFVEENYHKRYAENTRETFRRQVLQQFEQARIVDRNPDDPSLPTNSPRTHYAISESALPIIQGYGTKAGQRLLDEFKRHQGTLLEIYQGQRSQKMIPLLDPHGRKYKLSPGKHNQLQVAAIMEFAPRFARGSRILYLGDTVNKSLVVDVRMLQKLSFPADKHGILPDIVLYAPRQKWLYLIEVVTSHGPVSPKRHRELESILNKSLASRIYVSIFPDFKEYQRQARNIAWETEIWMADAPDHLIHYNGDKFIGPLPKSKIRRR